MSLSPVEQLDFLRAAEDDPARLALATIDIAHSDLAEERRQAIKDALCAAAVPHWVDTAFLAALLDVPHHESTALMERLRGLSVIEPFPARGADAVNVHETSRKALREAMRLRDPNAFLHHSSRARDFLASQTTDAARVEQLYHLFAIEPEAAQGELEALNRSLSVSRPEALQALASMVEELSDLPSLQGLIASEALDRVVEWRTRGTGASLAPAVARAELSDADALKRAQSGDVEALEALLARTRNVLQRWTRGRIPPSLRGELDEDDVIQEAFLHLISSLPKFQATNEGALFAYLRQGIQNKILDRLRRVTRHGIRESLEIASVEADTGPSPVQQMHEAQARERYVEALRRLNADDRELVIGRVELGYDYQELAGLTNRPSAAAARVAVSRAIVKLVAEINKD